jgi:protein involved in polysaccharide export with SLBB domain
MLLFALTAPGLGCAFDHGVVERNLMNDQTRAHQEGVAELYRVKCPDVVEVRVQPRPEFNARYQIGADGRINLGEYGQPRIDGQTPAEIRDHLVRELGVLPGQVTVRVREYRSQCLFLFGEVVGWQRSVPYEGQETVLDVLQRVGGITRGAEPDDVYVVRSHLTEGRRAEVFHVNLRAIVVQGDMRTNLRVQPYDQIYVGETAQARIQKQLHPWMQPLYRQIFNPPPTELRLPEMGH